MINKLTKMFAASQEAPVKTPEPPPEPLIGEAQIDTPVEQNPLAQDQDNVQQPLAAENISLLKLCDAKLAKFTKFFSGADEPVSAPEQTPTGERGDEAPSAAVIAPAPAQESVAAANISLLQLCDAKLSKWTKFFTGTEEAPAVTQETQTEERADGGAAVPPTPQEISLSADSSALNNENTVSATTSESIASSISDSPADNRVESAASEAEAAGLQSPLTTKIPEMQQSVAFDEAPLSAANLDNDEAIPELNRQQDFAIVEQLLNLERRLEQHIEDAIQAENERVSFREELRQQLNAAAHSYEQPLLEHKNVIETTLKSAFKKIVDRQAILENKYNQQIDMIQQVIGANQENIAETAEKLNKLSEQAHLLNENIRQLTQNIEAFQTKVDIDAVNARLTALENPPKKKRKSWFKK